MAGRFFLPAVFLRGGKRREKQGKNRKVFSMKHPRMHKKIWKILPHTYPSMRSER